MADEQAGLRLSPSELADIDPVGNPFISNTNTSTASDIDTELAEYDAWSESILQQVGYMDTPEIATGPQVFYSPSSDKMFVNGAMFDREDYQSALDSKTYLERPPTLPPAEVTDWQRVDPDNYGNYIKNIKDPSLGTQVARNVEIGGSVLKLLGGYTLQAFGAEETGQSWVDKAVEEMYHNEPFQREFTEIDVFENEGGHGGIDWFVSNLAQQGPMLLFSMATALAGSVLVPTTAAATVGLGIASLLGKQGYQKAVVNAANKYIVQGGKGLTKGEKKLLREVSALAGVAKIKNPKIFVVDSKGAAKLTANREMNRQNRENILFSGAVRAKKGYEQQARTGGAAIGLYTGNIGIGIGDIYGEVRETGVGDRGTAFMGAPFYALMESLPEFVIGAKIFGVNPAKMRHGKNLGKLAKKYGEAGGLGQRVLTGFAVGGALEGATELGQELLIMKATDQDALGSQEQIDRLVNSFAAGFGVGGTIGGAANIFTREQINKKNLDNNDPTNLLGNKPTEPGSTTDPAPGGKDSNILNDPKAYEMRPQSAPTGEIPPTPTGTEVALPQTVVDENVNITGGERLRRGVQEQVRQQQARADFIPYFFNRVPGLLAVSDEQFESAIQDLATKSIFVKGGKEVFIDLIPQLREYRNQNKRAPLEGGAQPVFDDANIIPENWMEDTGFIDYVNNQRLEQENLKKLTKPEVIAPEVVTPEVEFLSKGDEPKSIGSFIPKDVTNKFKEIQARNKARQEAIDATVEKPVLTTTEDVTPQQVDTPPPAEPTLQDRMTDKIAEVIRPTARKHLKKEQVKTKIATQFIGDGAPNSSSSAYKNMYAEEGLANTGRYTQDDVVFVASNGRRKNRVNPVKDGKLQGVYKNIDDAITSGATIVMDTSAHLAMTKTYNLGEIALAEYLTNAGYVRQGKTGIWKPGRPTVVGSVDEMPDVDKEIEVLAPFIEDTTEEGTTILKEVEQRLDADLKKKGYTVTKTDDGTIVKEPDAAPEPPAEEAVGKKGDKLKAEPVKITDPTDPRYKLKVVLKGKEVGTLSQEEVAKALTKVKELITKAEGGFFFDLQGERVQKEKLDKDKAPYKNLISDRTAIREQRKRLDTQIISQEDELKKTTKPNVILKKARWKEIKKRLDRLEEEFHKNEIALAENRLTDKQFGELQARYYEDRKKLIDGAIGRFGTVGAPTAKDIAENIESRELNTDSDIVLANSIFYDEVTKKDIYIKVKQNLRNRRGVPDLKADKDVHHDTASQIVSNEEETNILNPDIREAKFKDLGYEPVEAIGNITPEGLVDIVGLATLSKIMISGKKSTNYIAGHHNGGIILNSRFNWAQAVSPNIVAHELGHAAHSLKGAQIDAIKNIDLEMARIQEYLYPGLEQRLEEAIENEEKADVKFFSYLLSGNELIAEFNVKRILDPVGANQAAPNVAKLLAEAMQDPNLVRQRNTFPDGFNRVIEVNVSFINKDNPDGINYRIVNATMPGKEGSWAYMPGESLKKGERYADKKQSTTKVVTSEQTGVGRTTTEGDEKEPTRKSDLKVSGRKTKEGKAALQDKARRKDKPGAETGEEQTTEPTIDPEEISVAKVKEKWNEVVDSDVIEYGDKWLIKDYVVAKNPELLSEVRRYIADGELNEITVLRVHRLAESLEIPYKKLVTDKKTGEKYYKPEVEDVVKEVGSIFWEAKSQFDRGANERETFEDKGTSYKDGVNTMLRFAYGGYDVEGVLGLSGTKTVKAKRDEFGGMSYIEYAQTFFSPEALKEYSPLEVEIIKDEFIRIFSKYYNPLLKQETVVGRKLPAIGEKEKKVRPWFEFARDNSLGGRRILDLIRDNGIIITGRVEQAEGYYLAILGTNAFNPTRIKISQAATTKGEVNSIIEETDINTGIEDILSGKERVDNNTRDTDTKLHKIKIVRDIERAWENPMLNKNFKMDSEEGTVPLKAWFDKDGRLKLVKVGNKYEPTTKDSNAKKTRRQDKKVKGGNFKRVDNGEAITDPVPKGKIELIVKQIIKKLKVKPKVTIVADKDELRSKYPKLYAKARKGRALYDDFDEVAASGYSIGNQIILFSDFMATEEQVKFTIAHEVLGHYGFKALAPDSHLRTIFRHIYEQDSEIKDAADFNIDQGMEKYEAIEEALADKAAVMKVNYMGNLWKLIKNWFRKFFGLDVGDEWSRYFISQARRNLYNGGGSVISIEQFNKNIRAMNRRTAEGRFTQADTLVNEQSLVDKLAQSMSLNKYTVNTGNSWHTKEGVKDLIKTVSEPLKTGKDFVKSLGEEGGIRRGWEKMLEGVQSLNNKAVKSFGLRKVFNLFAEKTAMVRKLQQIYEAIMPFSLSPSIKIPFTDIKLKLGATTEEKYEAGELAVHANLHLANIITDADVKKAVDKNGDGIIIIDESGRPTLNESFFEQLKERGKLTREQFEKGLNITYDLKDDGVTPNVDPIIWKPKFKKTDTNPKGKITDRHWKIYKEMRTAIDESAKDIALRTMQATFDEKHEIIKSLKESLNQEGITTEVTTEDLNLLIDTYQELYNEGRKVEAGQYVYDSSFGGAVNKARMFMREVQRAIAGQENDIKLNKDWKGDGAGINDKLLGDFENVFNKDMKIGDKVWEFKSIIKSLERMNNAYKNDADKINKAYEITNTIQDFHVDTLKNENAEFYARRTILTGYVPFTREGDVQVTVRAYDEKGNQISLSEKFQSAMPYYLVRNNKAAEPLVEDLQELFPADETYIVINKSGAEVEAKFKVQYGEAAKISVLPGQPTLSEFMAMTTRLNIPLTPEQRERVVKGLTNVEAKARKNLQLSGTSGWSKDVLTGIARHLETSAHVAGKSYYQNKLARIMDDERNWTGDSTKLKDLHDAMLLAEKYGTPARIVEARRKYDAYANQYRYMAPKAGTVKMYKGGIFGGGSRTAYDAPTLGQGKRYSDDARKLIAFYEDAAGEIDVSSEDLLQKSPLGSQLKLYTVMSQLGMSFAAGMANLTSIPLHAHSYLAFYNSKKGYGGGFGWASSGYELGRALKHMSDPMQSIKGEKNIADYSFTQKLAKDNADGKALRKKYHLTLDEAQALNEVTGEGVLQAAQFNALVGSARGGVGNTVHSYFVRKYMAPFSYTEQLNRRTTFMAAYRLQKKRLIAAGNTFNAEIQTKAMKFANKAVVTSQGDYALYNRPELIRGTIAQYLFIYKQFLVITIENLANMDYKGKLYFAALLLAFSGVKGMPFAEDLRDLLNTLIQKGKLPFAITDVEHELHNMFEDIHPGLGKYMMRGLLDAGGGGTFSTRLGFGDMIPGTGIFLAGDQSHEVKNAAGPMYSFIEQSAQAISAAASYGVEFVGLKPDRTEFVDDVLRQQPFGAIRGFADAFTYLEDGRIVHPDGKVLTESVSTKQIIFRALNFFPASVNYQYDIIRYGQTTSNYINIIRQGFSQDYIKARLEGDSETMTRVEQEVEDWNSTYEGTEFYLRNWHRNTRKQYKLMKLPAVQRYLKTTPKGIRGKISELEALYGEHLE